MKAWIVAFGAVLLLVSQTHAAVIAVFGDNNIDNYVNSASMPGFSAVLVTDAQLSTAGFLNSFDAFVMTRNGFSFGTGLSAAATANVAAYVGSVGNVVLLNGDFADGVTVGSSNPESSLVRNSIQFAASSGRGFVGELNGAVAGLTSNSSGYNPIGLITGSAGPVGGGAGGSSGQLVLTSAGMSHSVTSGIASGVNPGSVEFGATISGVNPTFVLATWGVNGNAAVIARQGVQAVPEPSTLVVFCLSGLGMAIGAVRGRRKSAR